MSGEIHIDRVEPALGSTSHVFMLESFTVTLVLRTSFPKQLLRPQIWSNVIHKRNPQGKWHGLDMLFMEKDSAGRLHYQAGFFTTSQGTYEYTLRVGLRKFVGSHGTPHNPSNGTPSAVKRTPSSNSLASLVAHSAVRTPVTFSNPYVMDDDVVEWKWLGEFGKNCVLTVDPPIESLSWSKGPEITQILPKLYTGNFIAASQAKDMGFGAVMNTAAELEDAPIEGIKYKKIPLQDGAQNTIDEGDLLKAVSWIEQRLREGNKVLIHCRAGIGRSGSIAISYMFYSHPEWTFDQVMDAIWKCRDDIFPHKNLQKTLERLFPRVTTKA